MFELNAKTVTIYLMVLMAWAPSASAINFDVDFAGHFSGLTSKQAANSNSSNRLLAFGGTASLAFPVFRLLGLGAHTDYSSYYQQSTPELGKGGNRGGTRWMTIAPFVNLHFGVIRFRFDYQRFGDYKLRYSTAAGQSLTYSKPTGYRGEAHVCVIRGEDRFYRIPGKCLSYAGVYYETVSYRTEISGATTRTMTNNLVLREAGVMIGVGF